MKFATVSPSSVATSASTISVRERRLGLINATAVSSMSGTVGSGGMSPSPLGRAPADNSVGGVEMVAEGDNWVVI